MSPERKYGHLINLIVNQDVSFGFPIENFDKKNYAKVSTLKKKKNKKKK